MLNLEKALVEVYRSNYEEYYYKIDIEVEAKAILTFKTFSDMSSYILFWIYASNAGTVEYAKVNIQTERIEKRGSFQVPSKNTSMENIVINNN